MKTIKSLLLAGVAVAGLGGIAAADPCHPPSQPTVTYQNGDYGYDYDDDDYDRTTDEGYTQPAPVYSNTYSSSYSSYTNEPAPGTYQNGYVWVAGAYSYPSGVAVWTPGHWQLVQPVVQPVQPEYRRPIHAYMRPRGWGRTARSYRWRSRW